MGPFPMMFIHGEITLKPGLIEFETPFFQAREDINLDAEECALTYEVERKPLKAKTEAPKGRNSQIWRLLCQLHELVGHTLFWRSSRCHRRHFRRQSPRLHKICQTLAFLAIKGHCCYPF